MTSGEQIAKQFLEVIANPQSDTGFSWWLRFGNYRTGFCDCRGMSKSIAEALIDKCRQELAEAIDEAIPRGPARGIAADTPADEQTSHLRRWVRDGNPNAELLRGFDGCIVGMANRTGMLAVAVYDIRLVVQQLMARGMSEEEAEEFFATDIATLCLGPNAPLFMRNYPV